MMYKISKRGLSTFNFINLVHFKLTVDKPFLTSHHFTISISILAEKLIHKSWHKLSAKDVHLLKCDKVHA